MLPKAERGCALTIQILSKNDVYKFDTCIDIALRPDAERQIIAEHEKNGSVGIHPGTRRKAGGGSDQEGAEQRIQRTLRMVVRRADYGKLILMRRDQVHTVSRQVQQRRHALGSEHVIVLFFVIFF